MMINTHAIFFYRGEGNTPLVRSMRIGPMLGLQNLYFKLEHLNPTGSYKDRFAAAFIKHLHMQQQQVCLGTTSGNTGAALAAYCAAAKIECHILAVQDAPSEKLRQIQLYGGQVHKIKGFGVDAAITRNVFDRVVEFAQTRKSYAPISAYCYCPVGMKGIEIIVSELLNQLDKKVDHIFCPAGGGGLALAIATGVIDSKQADTRVHCVQPKGNNTIAGPLANGDIYAVPIERSATSISGLQVPTVLDGNETIRHCRITGGTGFLIEDQEVIKWQQVLALEEGIFCEAAGAVSISGLKQALRKKVIAPHEKIVCIISGSGFKNIAAVQKEFRLSEVKILNNINDFLKTLSNK